MDDVSMIVAPSPSETRLLMTINGHEILKAALPQSYNSDLRALPRILEGLALWTQQRVSVVLVAGEAVNSSCGAIYEALEETSSLHYEVGVAVREGRRRPRQRIRGVANFRDLKAFVRSAL